VLKRTGFAVLTAAVLASSSAWTAQFGLTSTQAKSIAKFQSVTVLVAVSDELRVIAPKEACTELEAVKDWEFRKQIEDHASRLLATCFTVVPKTYRSETLTPARGFLNQVPRSALPAGDDVDAFVVLHGAAIFLHAAGLPAPGTQGALFMEISKPYTVHDPEIAYTRLTVDVIDAKSKKTIARKEFPPALNQAITEGGYGIYNERFVLRPRSTGAKERAEADWICGSPLTEEKKQALKIDFRAVIQGALDEALPILRLAQQPEQRQDP